MDFKIKPYAHQMKAIEIAMNRNELGLLWEMGAGKTGAAINIMRLKFAMEKRIMRTLIVSPLVTLNNWKKEVLMHSKINLSDIVVSPQGTDKILKELVKRLYDEEQQMLFKSKILIINYESVRSPKILDALISWGPEFIIADECHRIKSHKASQSKAMVKLGDGAKYRLMLSGTPVLNKPFDIYNQFRFLDKGATFGRNISVFMNTYMIDENASWAAKDNHFAKYELNPRKAEELTDLIGRKCYRISKAEALPDLPPLIKKSYELIMSPSMRKHYEEMLKNYITFVVDLKGKNTNNAVVAQTAMTKALRLLQITSGILSDEAGAVSLIHDNPKIEAVSNLLTEIVLEAGNKCILWCCFIADYAQLSTLCEKLEIDYRFIRGEDNLAAKSKAIEDFDSDPNVKVMIANRRAGGIGINMVKAKYSIVYSRNFSLEDELQSEARNHRGGSEIHDSIVKIDLFFKDTIEGATLEALRSKQNMADKILDLSFTTLYNNN